MSAVSQAQANYDAALAKQAALQAKLDAYHAQGIDGTDPQAQATFEAWQASQTTVNLAWDKLKAAEAAEAATPAPESAGTTVASSDDGTVQNPKTLVVPEGRINQATDVATGEAVDTRTLENTQNVPEVGGTEGRPEAGGQPGAGSPPDDSAGTRTATKQIIQSSFNTTVTPEPNILDNYASYTYAISWYILPPDAVKNLFSTGKKSVAGYQLLAQSGGAPASSAGLSPSSQGTDLSGPNVPSAVANAGRNPYFDVDYYIDNLELESKMVGRGARLAHNVAELKFTLTEPNGITLMNKLYQAVNDLYKTSNLPYTKAQFCLVIRFYGYDANGNLVTKIGKQPGTSDPSAVVEKFYPFLIKNLNFRLANKQVEYTISGAPIPYFVNAGQNLGVIKAPIELAGATVKDVLTGSYTVTTPGDDGRKTTTEPKSGGPKVPPIPYTNSYLSAEQMQANQDWYNKYGANYNADGTPKT